MSSENIFSHFNLFLKIKNQSLKNKPSSKKYSLVKEIELAEGDNLIGSDIEQCQIYLPFEYLPKTLGKLRVVKENDTPKIFLTDFGYDKKFSLTKDPENTPEPNKEYNLKPNQKIYISNLVEFYTQKIYFCEEESVCFEEIEHKNDFKTVDNEELSDKISFTSNENENETKNLNKRNNFEFNNGNVNKEFEEFAENEEVLEEVENPFSIAYNVQNLKKIKIEKKITTPKKFKNKKQIISEIKTSHKIDNFFKVAPINNENLKTEKKIISSKINKSPQKLFTDKPETSNYIKSSNVFSNIDNSTVLLNDFDFIERSLKNKEKLILDERKMKNELLKQNSKNVDLIQGNPHLQTEQMFEELKQLTNLKWWICFSNIKHSVKHKKILKSLKTIPNITIVDDFETFINEESDSSTISKVLIMDGYKRTYKLIIAMNKNVLPLDYKWLEHISENQSIFKSPSKFFISYPQNFRMISDYNKHNTPTWFQNHSHKFTINLLESFKMRQQSNKGFLENHNVLVLTKCFKNYKIKNLNIQKNSKKSEENESVYIMRRMIETADGQFICLNSLEDITDKFDESVVNILIVDKFDYPNLEKIYNLKKIKIFSKESFLNSFLKQYLHSNEIYKPVKNY